MRNDNKVDEGSFGPTFKKTGKDHEGKERHGWSDFAKGRLNKARERGRQAKAERQKKYDAMTPEEQEADDRMWAEVKADKIEKMSRESVDLERWRNALENGKSVVLENEEIISLMRLDEDEATNLDKLGVKGGATNLNKIGGKGEATNLNKLGGKGRPQNASTHKVITKSGSEENVSGEDLKSAGKLYDKLKKHDPMKILPYTRAQWDAHKKNMAPKKD